MHFNVAYLCKLLLEFFSSIQATSNSTPWFKLTSKLIFRHFGYFRNSNHLYEVYSWIVLYVYQIMAL